MEQSPLNKLDYVVINEFRFASGGGFNFSFEGLLLSD